MKDRLADGYTMRRPATDDAEAVTALYGLSFAQFGARIGFTAAELLHEWKETDLENNAWVVLTPDGLVIGYEEVIVYAEKARFIIDGVVHPAHGGQGIGSWLVAQAEARVRALCRAMDFDGRAPTIHVTFNGKDARARALFEGYDLEKSDVVMKIELDGLLPEPARDDGIVVREFVPEEDERAVFDVIDRAFQSIRGYDERSYTFEQWREFSVARAGFDPSLWFLAVEDGAVVGVCLCPHDRGIGWIRNVAVLPEQRGRGIGVMLMRHAFREWYRRGQREVGLAVQGDNVPAIRLYEKVGMQVESVFETYRRALE